MFPFSKILMSILLIILCSIREGATIKCWVCRSDSFGIDCADPFVNVTVPIVNCDYEKLSTHPGVKPTLCRKIKQKVDGVTTIIRTCGFLHDEGKDGKCQSMTSKAMDVFRETCTCNSKDGCNNSNEITVQKSLLVPLLFSILFVHWSTI